MPRIRQYAEKYQKEDLLREIDVRCAWNGIKTQESLGKFLGVSPMTITNLRRASLSNNFASSIGAPNS